ncbi:MAG: hypothetical protein FWG99_09670 [Treponema sp.]|nr:hypothetical protein [Treponema sp.]
MTANIKAAIIFRSIAIFAVLYQLRLIAADLADTPVFTAVLLCAFAAAVFLKYFRPGGKPAGALGALAAICLIPWITRLFTALPRIFIPGNTGPYAIALDSLLLNFDRNNFVSILPFYWIAASTWFCITSRKFLRAAVIADATILIVIYSIARSYNIVMYRWPIVMIVVFTGIVFFMAMGLLFSMPPNIKMRAKEIGPAVTALLALLIFGGFIFLKPFQERAIERGGGLLEPKLFSFDFSQILKLDTEISMSDDLILIVKKDSDDHNILLRRSVLSGYSPRQGFYRIEELDEKNHPLRLPRGQLKLSPAEFKKARSVNQEYFLVNFDAAAFIGMKEPVLISPYENWDASSFNSAFAVESLVSTADYLDFINIDDEQFNLSENELKIYTEYGGDERIRAYAMEITDGYEDHAGKVWMIHDRLKYGEYRYSLKPGIAPDGDQLGFFLFNSKKGYCSYYAFAMTLLLRSLGIPARVAAGFFIDPDTNTFDYYPVRSDMAHAWVEVAFPGYGWIEFDPTSEQLSEGEEFRFSSGVDPALFEKLMREILENRSGMRLKEGLEEESAASNFNSLAQNALEVIKNNWLPILLSAMALLFLWIRCSCLISVYLTGSPRKRSIRLMRHARRRLHLAGLRRPTEGMAEAEWALRLEKQFSGIYAMYQAAAAARFAQVYSTDDHKLQLVNYSLFTESYKKEVPLHRRIAGWIFPPLALLSGSKKSGRVNTSLLVFLLLAAFFVIKGEAQNGESLSADELYMSAAEAEFAEMWERAIELYKEGSDAYPDDARFSWSLGNLYYSRSLYGLAWDEYRKTEIINPFNQYLLIRLARTAGYLNQDHMSVEYYKRALSIDPNNRDAIGSLGWMYFKVHKLRDGERLLTDALERFGDDADFSMTLGTLYSSMYNYDDGKYWYNKAISLGESIGDRVFAAVAYYNLSILETHFYRYALSMEAANSSLDAQNRASGRLARGELYMRRLDLEEAQKEYAAAYEIDTSPLAKLNLAQVYQISGRLEEARLYAEDCLGNSDHSWMLNYGIDPDRYKRDIHEILYKTYSGLAQAERFMPLAGTGEKIHSLLKIIIYSFKHSVHLRLFGKYSLAAAAAYGAEPMEDGSPNLDSLFQYFNAFKTYPRRGIAYLNRARAFETSIIPEAEPSYDLEEGVLLKNTGLVRKALTGFDPFWELEPISQCYGEFAGGKNSRREKSLAAQELFALNRGALRQAGITLPVQADFVFFGEGAADASRSKKHFTKALAKAGFVNPAGLPARFSLNVTISGSAASGYTVFCDLADSEGKTKTLHHSFPLRSLTKTDVYDFAREFGNAVFRVE